MSRAHVRERRRTEELEDGVKTFRRDRANSAREGVIIGHDMVGANVVQQVRSSCVASGGDDGGAELVGDRDGGATDGKGAAVDEHLLAGFQVEAGC